MPAETVWEIGEHSQGKHLVLRRYLDAWLPILGMKQERILFIDGFAGPGVYAGGEVGSPIIAMRALKEHHAKGKFRAEVVFLFVEDNAKRVAHLRKLVDSEKVGLPPGTQVFVERGKFDATITTALDALEKKGDRLAPTLLMVDPFGVSDTPMSVIQRVLRHPKSEVYVSFMYEAINRWKTTPEFERPLDSLFGCPDWRAGIGISDPIKKKDFFFSLYRDRLKAAGASQVIHFELYEGGRLVYAIFFGSQHSLGCDRMKQAIWGVAPFGDYVFRGVASGQLGLDLGEPDLKRLGDELRAAFSGPTWVSIEQLEEFSKSDRTGFHSGHLKAALRRLEQAGGLIRQPSPVARRGSFPPGTRVRMVSTAG